MSFPLFYSSAEGTSSVLRLTLLQVLLPYVFDKGLLHLPSDCKCTTKTDTLFLLFHLSSTNAHFLDLNQFCLIFPWNFHFYFVYLILSGSEETQGDRTRIVIDATAKMDYEAGRDASKFMSPEASAAQLFTTVGGLRYAINNRPLSDGIVELGLSIGTTGSYTIALSTKVEGEVYLIDRETGSEIRLDGTEGYTFQATKGTVEGRFAVRFGNGDLTGIKGVAVDGKDAGNWYNVNGQRVNAPAKGIYIQNGKKTVVK